MTEPWATAEQVSADLLRDLQNADNLLGFIIRAAARKFRSTVALMDWARVTPAT